MYPLHLNYTTTLPCKTITMKITIFIIVLVLKSTKIWKFDISDCHSLLTVHNTAKTDVFKVSAPSLTHKLEVFLQSSVWPCWWSSVADHPILFARLSSARRWFWLGLKCLVSFKHSFPNMVIKRIKVWWVWWPFVVFPMKSLQLVAIQFPLWKTVIFIVIVLHGSVFVFSFFLFRFHYMDFPDCLLLLLSISVSTL